MYGYFANKNKHRLIVKNIYKNMAIYLKIVNLFVPKKNIQQLMSKDKEKKNPNMKKKIEITTVKK